MEVSTVFVTWVWSTQLFVILFMPFLYVRMFAYLSSQKDTGCEMSHKKSSLMLLHIYMFIHSLRQGTRPRGRE